MKMIIIETNWLYLEEHLIKHTYIYQPHHLNWEFVDIAKLTAFLFVLFILLWLKNMIS